MSAPRPFASTAVSAFPPSCRSIAGEGARTLATLVDDAYQQRSTCLEVLGEQVWFPYRFHIPGLAASKVESLSLPARCLVTRSTDGHLRQQALRTILSSNFAWNVPFVVMLAGEYVVEISQEIQSSISLLDRDAYAHFARENRATMAKLRSRATSYWDCYYRTDFPERGRYPGLVVLHEIERWAS